MQQLLKRSSVSGAKPMSPSPKRTLARSSTRMTTLAVHRGHGGHAQVQLAPLDAGLDAPVLRQAALGDVQVRQQLDARADGRALPRRHHLAGVQHAVDAVAHVQAVVEGLQVDVGGAQLDHAPDQAVDQADHRRLAGQVAQVLDEVARALLVQRPVVAGFGRGLLLLALQRLADVGGQAHGGAHRQAGGQVQGLEHEGVLRRAHDHVEPAVLGAQRQHVVGLEELGQQAGQLGRHLGKRLGGHEGQAQVLGQRVGGVGLRHQAQADQHAVQRAAHLVLRSQRPLQVARRELAGAHQQLAVLGPAHGPAVRRGWGRGRNKGAGGQIGHGLWRARAGERQEPESKLEFYGVQVHARSPPPRTPKGRPARGA
jgi:hypothetical protein